MPKNFCKPRFSYSRCGRWFLLYVRLILKHKISILWMLNPACLCLGSCTRSERNLHRFPANWCPPLWPQHSLPPSASWQQVSTGIRLINVSGLFQLFPVYFSVFGLFQSYNFSSNDKINVSSTNKCFSPSQMPRNV